MIEEIHDPDFGPYRWATVNMAVGPGIALMPMLALSILLNIYCTSECFTGLATYTVCDLTFFVFVF
jgi:hypothetical protein